MPVELRLVNIFAVLALSFGTGSWALADDEPMEGEAAEVAPAEEAAAPEPARRYAGGIEEITVTATKREANIQDVPIAISAFTGDDLQRRGIQELEALQQVAPSLIAYTSNSESNGGTLRIRGMGTTGNNAGLEAAVGTFIDGVYRSRSGQAFSELLDIERVEILRGPQGTLFGKNTSAGAVHILTAKPEFDFNGRASYTIGDYNYDKGTLGVTGPLIEETLAYRLAAMFSQREGYYNDIASSDKFSDRDRWSVKGQLLWTPTDTMDVRLIYDYTDRDESCCPAIFKDHGPTTPAVELLGGYTGPSDPSSLDVGVNGDPFEKVTDQGLSLEVNWDLGPDMTLTSVTAWRDYRVNRGQDVDFTSADILSLRDENEKWKNFSTELRLVGTTGPVDWLVGAYTYQERFDTRLATPFGSVGPSYVGILLEGASAVESSVAEVTGFLFPGDSGGAQRYDQDTEGFSIFTHNTWHITDRLSFTAGGRYSKEKKKGKSSVQNGDLGLEPLPLPGGLSSNESWCNGLVTVDAVGGPLPLRIIPGLEALCDNAGHFDNTTEREVSGTFKLAYQLTDDVSTYGSYSRGYKAGGFNLDPNANQLVTDLATGATRYQDESNFKPEFADAYEVGLKAQLFDNRLTVNSAVFYTQFEDFQLNTFKGLFFTVSNLPEVTSRGVEVETFFELAPGVSGSLGGTYAITRYSNDVGGNPPQLSGQRLTHSPRFQGSGSLLVEQPIPGTSFMGFLSTSVSFQSEHNTGSDLDLQKDEHASWFVNAQVGARTDDERYEVVFWVTNLTDKSRNSVVFDSVFQGGSYHTFVTQPRMMGVTLTTHF